MKAWNTVIAQLSVLVVSSQWQINVGYTIFFDRARYGVQGQHGVLYFWFFAFFFPSNWEEDPLASRSPSREKYIRMSVSNQGRRLNSIKYISIVTKQEHNKEGILGKIILRQAVDALSPTETRELGNVSFKQENVLKNTQGFRYIYTFNSNL